MKRILILSLAVILILGMASTGTFGLFSDTETSVGNTFTAWVEEGCACYGFNVSDITQSNRRIFTYDVSDSSASFISFFDLDDTNSDPSGVASVGDYIYVSDWSGKKVYKYDCCGNLLGVSKDLKRSGSSIANPSGLAIDGDDMWVVAYGQGIIIYHYSLSAAFSAGDEIDADLQIPYHEDNTSPSGLAINSADGYLYVPDIGENRFYRYDYLNYDPNNPPDSLATVSKILVDTSSIPLYRPAGAMFDGTHLWIVDNRLANNVNRAYKYDIDTLFPGSDTETENALWEFDLYDDPNSNNDNIGSTGI